MESQLFMKTNFTKILNELSYRVSSGIPDLTNEQHLIKLWDILKEHNWSVDARVKVVDYLKCYNGNPDHLTEHCAVGMRQSFWNGGSIIIIFFFL